MAESVNTAGASAPASPLPLVERLRAYDRTAEVVGVPTSLVREVIAALTVVTTVTEAPNECQWCGSEDDVRPLRGENLCVGCRYVVAFRSILSGVDE